MGGRPDPDGRGIDCRQMGVSKMALCWIPSEPTIADILSDPITVAMMKADGVDPVVLDEMLSGVAHARAAVRQRTSASGE